MENLDLNQILDEINSSQDVHTLLHVTKPKFLGKESQLHKLLIGIKNLPPEARKLQGALINKTKQEIEDAISIKRERLESGLISAQNIYQEIDITIPALHEVGAMHPVSFASNEIINIFARMGFEFKDGPEIEDDYHNFTSLNVPMFHPARQMQDTFYIANSDLILRTHTTAVDVRAGKVLTPPFKIMSLGKTYRNESDKTHSPMFHQFEGLYIDKNLSLADLKSYLVIFLQEFFEVDEVNLNFRPSYFPFTTPSAEVDIYYHHNTSGEIVFGTGDKMLEILGCGMLHRNVLTEMNIDAEEFSAIAFGGGVERLAMLKYGMNDIRHFYNGSCDFVKHYKF